jgi:prophage lambdaBa04, site-specific recombinase, phage integrase family protein
MATVHARKRGNKWEYRFEAASVAGQRKQICKSGYASKKEAMEAGAKAYSDYTQAGAVFEPNNSSFADYLDYWLGAYCVTNLKPITLENYKKKIRLYIKPKLGKYMLSSLSFAVLQDFINDIFNQGFSRNTLTVIKGILSNSLSYAVEPLHYLQSSPMTYVKLPSTRAKPAIPSRSEPHIYISKDMINKIFERFPEGSSAHIPLMLGYKCGLRLGEAFGVMWSDIDFIKCTLTINRQVQWQGGSKEHGKGYWYFSEPKYNAFRTIALDSSLIELLEREKQRQERAAEYYADKYIHLFEGDNSRELNTDGKGVEIYPICRRENGEYIQSRVMQHTSMIIHTQLGCEDFDYHSLRHTHATNLDEAGANPKYVQARLGHKNIQVTMQIYQHTSDTIIEQGNNILQSMYC